VVSAADPPRLLISVFYFLQKHVLTKMIMNTSKYLHFFKPVQDDRSCYVRSLEDIVY
jgi:hypothetical protein